MHDMAKELRNILESAAGAGALAIGVYELLTHFTPLLTASLFGLALFAVIL